MSEFDELPQLRWAGRHPMMRIARQKVPLPPEARAQLRNASVAASGKGYRGVQWHDPVQGSWFVVLVRSSGTGRSEALWPAVRTLVPAGISGGLAVSLLFSMSALGAAGAVGAVLGSVVSGLIARTQYTVEREQHALEVLLLSTDARFVALATFPSLAARIAGRVRWSLLPIDALASQLGRGPSAPWLDGAHRLDAVLRAMGVLGVPGVLLDPFEAERVYTLVRLGRLRARSAT